MENKNKVLNEIQEKNKRIEILTNYCQNEFVKEGLEYENKDIAKLLNTMEIKGLLKNLQSKPDLIVYFVKMCSTLKLNPLLNEIYAIPYNNTLQIVVDFKQYIARAKNCEGYCGYETILVDKDSEGKDLPLNQVYYIVKCKRKSDEFIHTSIYYMNEWNKNIGEWKSKPKYMLEKTAIKNTLAHIFPEALSHFVNAESTGMVIDDKVQEEIEDKELVLDIKNVVGK